MDQARDSDREFVRRVLISEGASIAVGLLFVWYMGPGRVWLQGIAHQARARIRRRHDHIDSEAARFAGEISRWEHEQAAKSRHPTGRGGCGCDGG